MAVEGSPNVQSIEFHTKSSRTNLVPTAQIFLIIIYKSFLETSPFNSILTKDTLSPKSVISLIGRKFNYYPTHFIKLDDSTSKMGDVKYPTATPAMVKDIMAKDLVITL